MPFSSGQKKLPEGQPKFPANLYSHADKRGCEKRRYLLRSTYVQAIFCTF